MSFYDSKGNLIMKKSKILVPALGILVLSTAAAVSGTVAWFAATRTATVGVKNNTIVNPEGALKVVATAGHCTTVASGDETNVSISEGVKLRDASVDITAAKNGTSPVHPSVYRAKVDESGAVTKFELLTSYTDAYNTTDKVYYCATFALTFTLDGSNTSEFDVFFDASKSTYTIDTSAESGVRQDAIHNSYRLAMYTDAEQLVWAPKSSTPAAVPFTNGLTSTSLGSYNCTFPATTVTSLSYASHTEAAASAGYLGQLIGKDANVESALKQLVVNCVIWFDGNDPQCIADNLIAGAISQATASLSFNAVEASEFRGTTA